MVNYNNCYANKQCIKDLLRVPFYELNRCIDTVNIFNYKLHAKIIIIIMTFAVLVYLLGYNPACSVNNVVILYRISNGVKKERKCKVTDQVGVWFSWKFVYT